MGAVFLSVDTREFQAESRMEPMVVVVAVSCAPPVDELLRRWALLVWRSP
jgi:hypothetical protein